MLYNLNSDIGESIKFRYPRGAVLSKKQKYSKPDFGWVCVAAWAPEIDVVAMVAAAEAAVAAVASEMGATADSGRGVAGNSDAGGLNLHRRS